MNPSVGVCFLPGDEVSEIPAHVLDSLRIPLETTRVVMRRGRREVTYPADFQLVMAANPCQCGKEAMQCTCSASARLKHLANVSGPLRDRLDIFIATSTNAAVVSPQGTETSAQIGQRVAEARERAAARWLKAGVEATINARVSSTVIRRHFPPDEASMALLQWKLRNSALTQRGVDRVLKLAWTLADLDGDSQPHIDHVERAISLRKVHSVGVAA